MYCPECGTNADDAKFCPECGANLGGVRGAVKGKTTGSRGSGSGRPGRASAEAAQPVRARGGLSPVVLWGAIAVVAVAIVVAVALVSGDSGGGAATSATNGGAPASLEPISADTSGSYRELVARANDLYDKGDQQFRSQNIEQGAQYFAAAAQVYEAAWKKQPGDPNVGTDWATSMFYSGDFDAAVKQVRKVLDGSPDFQPAWYNLGNYIAHQARLAEQAEETDQAAKLYGQARDAYTKAVSIDPDSEVGKSSDERLAELPK
jgi:hypothetical protein